ncbi:hypothetical protein AKO1_008755 [Acrasis kona]|uniref:PAS domain-containing protein n=1 Tax=Acrasis kona TaxID=1008807 RepID=A0AAW2ZF12_9EUKA
MAKSAVAGLNENLKAAGDDLIILQTSLSVFEDVGPYQHFKPLISSLSSTNLTGTVLALSKYTSAYFYIDIVEYDNVTNYLSKMRSWGGAYSNITYISGSEGRPDIQRPNYFVLSMYEPGSLSISLNYGVYPTRNESLMITLANNKIYVADPVMLIVDQVMGILVYAPVIKNNKTVGFIGGSFRVTKLLESSALLDPGQGLALIDPQVNNTVLTVLTDGIETQKGAENYTYIDVQELLANSKFHSSDNEVVFYNRRYQVVYFTTVFKDNYFQIIPPVVASFVFLVGIAILIFSCAYRRMVVVKRVQEVTKSRIDVLENHRSKLSSLLKKSIKSETKARTIINAIPDLVVVINNIGKILQSNNSFDHVYSYNEQEWENGILIQTLLPELAPNFYEGMNDSNIVRTNALSRDGTKFFVDVKVSAVVDSDQNPTSATTPKEPSTSFRFPKDSGGDEEDECYVLVISRTQCTVIENNT